MDYPRDTQLAHARKHTILADGCDADEMLNERQVSAAFNISTKTLQNWRYAKPPRGPAYQKAGRKVLYKRGDIEQWLKRNRVEPQ